MTRPSLPVKLFNHIINTVEAAHVLPEMKYQTLRRDEQDILVGRVKIPTPNGHAFILRRFDTGAISLTTMFRAAYPKASQAAETREMEWAKQTYDIEGNNGSQEYPDVVRLAGTWVDTDTAKIFADAYSLPNVIGVMIAAQPDPGAVYRRSKRSTDTTAASSPKAPRARGLPSSTTSTESPSSPSVPNPAKRRKESSPAPAAIPANPAAVASPPRRSTRTKSPTPHFQSAPSISSVLTPTKPSTKPPSKSSTRKSARKSQVAPTPSGSDETVVEEEEETTVAPDLIQREINEQKQMIENLKAQRDNAMGTDASEAQKTKRAREEEDAPPKFDFKEPEVGERQIATNRRVGLGPRQKTLAWGALAFAAGLGAMTFLPNYLF
ncbi:hypothetical protein PLICRDRAFT_91077 [Plicaturopsis crispa FD-325 SS-3]|nr:hypothetical protein PLICRDRAFT_91077 [Plicaturopsis crispa FD-325 SS-3]